MNSVRIHCFYAFLLNKKLVVSLLLFVSCLVGCSDKVTLPSAVQLTEFENAGPLLPSLDTENLVKAKIQSQQYRVMPGEVIELTMPAILQAVTKDEYKEGEKYAPYMCRISDSGTITLPLVGELKASGLTLTQIENAVIEKYYPEYAVIRPSVFARIVEYNTYKVSVTGAVNKPGIYTLHNDQMTLVNLLMEAGGIINEGAAVIKITHPENVNPGNQRITSAYTPNRTAQTNQQLAGNADEILFNNPAKNINSENINVSFKQISSSSAKGCLVIKDGDKILLNELLDITDDMERTFMLKQLLWRAPGISTESIEQKLEELAEIIKPGFNNLHTKINTVRQYDLDFINNKDFTTKSSTANLGIYSNYNDPLQVQTKQTDNTSIQSADSQTIVLPVKGLNIPFADIVLKDGDSIIVERLQIPLFSVIGLVNKPSNFQYPPDVQYNLMQALAFAGGLDRAAEPRYATIYRLKPDGTITHAIFQVVNVKDRAKLTYALNTIIKPGDIIAVEHTPRTRTKVFVDSVFRLNIGTYFNMADAWND